MRRQITPLDESVASRIAAGEVIERPVSAAKEMIENSIDAGAQNITIRLVQGGKTSLVIEDDGSGIAFDELPLAALRHATSKISSLEDLERVTTLGYRGEALASIAAVSRLEIRSRMRGAQSGGILSVTAGTIEAHSEIPMAEGTRIRVDDLFFNMPARRKFLKSDIAEMKRIMQVVEDHALAYPSIRFRVWNGDRKMIDIGGGTTDDVLRSLWGDDNRAVESSATAGPINARIWWNAMPGSKRVSVTLFVNGRRIQDTTVRSALNSTGSSVFGEWVIMIDLPPEDVDVNIHPAKAEVRFRKSGQIFEVVRRAADRALRRGGGHSEPTADGLPEVPASIDPYDNMRTSPQRFAPSNDIISNAPMETAPKNEPKEPSIFAQEAAKHRRRYLGQAQGGYLVFDDERGLCLLDPHAAHERILYEQIESSYSSRSVDMQRLIQAQEIPPAIAASVAINRETLRAMGFAFSLPDDGPDSPPEAMMTSVPVLRGLARLSPIEMLRSAIRGIEEEDDPSKRDREVWWRWARTACRDAVKLGEAFDEREANDLFDRLERCRTPYSCPHGRPTTIFLAGDRLKSWFER